MLNGINNIVEGNIGDKIAINFLCITRQIGLDLKIGDAGAPLRPDFGPIRSSNPFRAFRIST